MPSTPTTRTCKTCGQTFPLDQFERAKRMRFGRSNRCKFCANQKTRGRSLRLVKKWTVSDPWKLHPTGVKLCPQCGIEKPTKDFSKSVHNTDGLQRECKPCQVIRYQLRTYGISLKPGDSCKICGSTKNLSIDHCHDTNFVRGVLCKNCNMGIAMFQDSQDLLAKAIDYLENETVGPMKGKNYRKPWISKSGRDPTDWSTVPNDMGHSEEKRRQHQIKLASDIMAALFPLPPQPKQPRFHSEETKKFIGDLKRGIKPSEDTKAKMAASMRAIGRKWSDETKEIFRKKAVERWSRWRARAEESGQHLSVGGHLKPPKKS